MNQIITFVLTAATLVSAAHAQGRSWVVDAANGAGTNFRDLPAAEAAASAGDRILIRAGNYTGIRTSKPLTLVGGANVVISQGGSTYAGLNISGIPAGAVFSAQGLRVQIPSLGGGALSATNCRGTIILEKVDAWPLTVFRACADVRMTACSLARVKVEAKSAALFDRCKLAGASAGFSISDPAVHVTSSVATFSRCDVRGFNLVWNIPNSAAVIGSAATLTFTGDGTGGIRAGSGSNRSAIEGSGSLVIDPRVKVVASASAPPIAASLTTTRRSVPSLRADNASPGGTVNGSLVANAGDSFFLALGFPAPPIAFPTLFGHLWMHDPLVFPAGVLGATGQANWKVPVPNSTQMVGLTFVWQALAGTATSGFALSNPATYTHPF